MTSSISSSTQSLGGVSSRRSASFLKLLDFPGGSLPRARGVEEPVPGRLYKALEVVTVRQGPELASPVVGELAKGDLVRASTGVGEDGRFQVLLRDGTSSGWVSALTRKHKTTLFAEAESDDEQSSGGAGEGSTSTTTTATADVVPGRVYQALEIATVRAGRDLASPVVGELAKGDLVLASTGVSKNGRFKVLLPDGRSSGWVSAVTRKQKTALFAEAENDAGHSTFFPVQSAPATTTAAKTKMVLPSQEELLREEAAEESAAPRMPCQGAETWEQPATMDEVVLETLEGTGEEEPMGITLESSLDPVPADEECRSALMPERFVRPSGIHRAARRLPPIPSAGSLPESLEPSRL